MCSNIYVCSSSHDQKTQDTDVVFSFYKKGISEHNHEKASAFLKCATILNFVGKFICDFINHSH